MLKFYWVCVEMEKFLWLCFFKIFIMLIKVLKWEFLLFFKFIRVLGFVCLIIAFKVFKFVGLLFMKILLCLFIEMIIIFWLFGWDFFVFLVLGRLILILFCVIKVEMFNIIVNKMSIILMKGIIFSLLLFLMFFIFLWF